MQIVFDSTKRDQTLTERGLNFARAGEVFAERHITATDERFPYFEERFVTVGWLNGRQVVWPGLRAARCAASLA